MNINTSHTINKFLSILNTYKLTICVAIIVLILCLIPGKQISIVTFKFKFIDKVEHFIAFFVLTSIIIFETLLSRKKNPELIITIKIFGLLIIYGIAIEFFQSFTPTRSADYKDFISDTLGIISSLLVNKLIISKYSKQLISCRIARILGFREHV